MLSYLRLTRAHTVPLEAVPALLGAALALGTVWDIQVALWAGFGVLYHLAGYGHNSITDWVNGYDVDDPHKQHHPLNTGALDVDRSAKVVNVLLIVTLIYGVALSANSPQALAGIGIALIAGLAYNVYGKRTQFKFLYISIAHSMVFLVAYLATGGVFNNMIVYFSFMYMFLWIIFQISVSGEIKDMGQDESNFLMYLGSSVMRDGCSNQDTYIEFSDYTQHYTYNIKVLTSIAALVITAAAGGGPAILVLILMLSITQLSMCAQLVRSGLWLRTHRLKVMSTIEMITAITMVFALSPIIGILEAFIICGVSVVWAIAGNRLLWGSLVAPSV